MSMIMIVDDEPRILFLVRIMLEKKGYNVVEAKNGEECLEKLKEEKPDLILLDVMMPGEDGWEICKKIKTNENTKDIPVAMFTVRHSDVALKKSIEYAHADSHINKPFNMKDLLKKVKRLLKGAASS